MLFFVLTANSSNYSSSDSADQGGSSERQQLFLLPAVSLSSTGWHCRSLVQARTSSGCRAAQPASGVEDRGMASLRAHISSIEQLQLILPGRFGLVAEPLPSHSHVLWSPEFAEEAVTRLVWHKASWFWLGVARGKEKVAFPPALCQNLAQKVRSVSGSLFGRPAKC